jgi:hypothetical protein
MKTEKMDFVIRFHPLDQLDPFSIISTNLHIPVQRTGKLFIPQLKTN